jgi:hypothetical protein
MLDLNLQDMLLSCLFIIGAAPGMNEEESRERIGNEKEKVNTVSVKEEEC